MPRFAKLVKTLIAVDLPESELLTSSEAAAELGLSLTALDDTANRRVDPLTRYVDQDEPNPMRQARWLRSEIRAEKARRRQKAVQRA